MDVWPRIARKANHFTSSGISGMLFPNCIEFQLFLQIFRKFLTVTHFDLLFRLGKIARLHSTKIAAMLFCKVRELASSKSLPRNSDLRPQGHFFKSPSHFSFDFLKMTWGCVCRLDTFKDTVMYASHNWPQVKCGHDKKSKNWEYSNNSLRNLQAYHFPMLLRKSPTFQVKVGLDTW